MATIKNPNENPISFTMVFVIFILFFLPSFVITWYRFSYFSNPDVDRQLLFFINIDFSRFVLASISFLILSIALLIIMIKAYKAKTLSGPFIFLGLPVLFLIDDVFKGVNILFHTNDIFQPAISTFDWSDSHDYMISNSNSMSWGLIIEFIFSLLYLYLFYRYLKKK